MKSFITRSALGLLLAIGVSMNPAWSQESADLFHASIQRSFDALERYEYAQAAKELNSAEIQYRRALQEYTRAGEDPADVWKLNLAMQTNLVMLYTMIGQRLFDQGNFNEALRMYQKSLGINATFPCTHYEIGYTYLQQKQSWKAAAAIYEAKRLARFPAYRSIVNHFVENGNLNCTREQVDTRGDGILSELGKSTDYPVDLDLATGQKRPNQIVPGIGAHLAARAKSVYLEQSLSSVQDALGEPLSQDGEVSTDRGETLRIHVYDQPRLALGFDTSSDTLKQIHVFEPGAPVATPKGIIKIGDHARVVLQQLGSGYGHQRSYNGINEDIREYHDYPALGLVFGIGKDDHIVTAAIYNLE